MISVAKKFNLIVIDVKPLPVELPCRDQYFNGPNHTKLLGAQYYASQFVASLNYILAMLVNFRQSNSQIDQGSSGLVTPGVLQSAAFSFDQASINEKVESLSIRFDPIINQLRLSFIFSFLVGPFSPVLAYAIKDSDNNILSQGERLLWDKYCHYERTTWFEIESLFPIGAARIDICTSKNPPDYGLCVNQDFSFDDFRLNSSKRYLVLNSKESYWVAEGDYLVNIKALVNV